MAPTPSTIPTSFVPKQPVRTGTHFEKTGGNTFLIVSLVILGIALLAAAGVFGYKAYLTSVRESKAAEVKQAQESIDTETVESFIRLRNRFSNANAILNERVAASRFFEILENLTLQNVRFDSLAFTLADDNSAEIRMGGTARTFNALAAQSAAFAEEKRVKRAIFSGISVNEDTDVVSFSLTADLDPKLLTLEVEDMPQPVVETTPTPEPTGTTTTP